MPPESSLFAVPVRLDLANERLWYGDQVRFLRPKTFALLRYLVAHPGQLLTKAALLEALWPETIVSDVVLAVCMRELRQALGDDARAPRFIETVHRRGYRFIGHLSMGPPSASHTASRPSSPLLVGREPEVTTLHRGLSTALTGVRQFIFVTGEAGLGKTTLVDMFLTAVEGQGPLWMGRGQCLEHYGAGEPYLPLLEAMERLCRGPGGVGIVEILRHQAPTWMVQMPGLLSPADLEGLQRRVLGTTQERMLRELAEALDVLSAAQPFVLVLEDLNWSEYSTLDALAALAQRREPARLLLLGTYRPPDALQRGHPLHTVQHELHMHGQCVELALPLLPEVAVANYLAARFPAARFPAGLARLVQQRTEGNPLFMVQVVEDWIRRGWVVQADGRWTLRVGLAALGVTVPEGLRQMLEQHLDRLHLRERQVLEVGSVVGARFSAATVADSLAEEVVQVEAWCADLARRQQWLEACGEQSWPDGTVAGSYRFTHTLYQEVAYTRLTAARRVSLHRQIGMRMEAGYGDQARQVAAELAVHFTRGHDAWRAVCYLQYAGENALQRSAYQEAVTHFTRGLEVLTALPDTPARARRELSLQTVLGRVLMLTKGHGAPEVEQALVRARTVGQQLGDTAALVPVQNGLWVVTLARADLRTARTLAAELFHMAQGQQERVQLSRAHEALGETLCYRGEFMAARHHMEECLALYEPQQHQQFGVQYEGPSRGVLGHAFLARILWLQGYPRQALARSHAALTLARQLTHPVTLALALDFAASVHQFRRDAHAVQEQTGLLLQLAREQTLPFREAWAQTLQGWVLAKQHKREMGIEQMWEGLAACRATGSELDRPWIFGLIAETSGQHGQVKKGLRVLDEALSLAGTTEERWYKPELHRLQGELFLHHSLSDIQQAEACFQQALAVARCQQAKSWELRAATSLSRLWQGQGKRTEAYDLLAPIYDWFTEGLDTADLQEAEHCWKR